MVTRDHIRIALDALEFQASEFESRIATRRMNARFKDMLATEIAKLNAARMALAEIFGIELSE